MQRLLHLARVRTFLLWTNEVFFEKVVGVDVGVDVGVGVAVDVGVGVDRTGNTKRNEKRPDSSCSNII